jgi:hypothetical protein
MSSPKRLESPYGPRALAKPDGFLIKSPAFVGFEITGPARPPQSPPESPRAGPVTSELLEAVVSAANNDAA